MRDLCLPQTSEGENREREFRNELDYNFQDGETQWIRSELNDDIIFRIQLQYLEEEDRTYVTDLQVDVKLEMINKYFKTSYT